MSTAISLLIRATYITQGSGRAFEGRVVLRPPRCWLSVVVSASPNPLGGTVFLSGGAAGGSAVVPCFSRSEWILLVGSKEGQLWSCKTSLMTLQV